MGNKPEDFVPYFMIRWARKSTWSLLQGAYLSKGLDPDEGGYEIHPDATNEVSKRNYWLKNRSQKRSESFPVMDTIDGVDRFNTGTLMRAIGEKFDHDETMLKAFYHIYDPHSFENIKMVTRSVYREAGRLIYEQYPYARQDDVAVVLVDLPDYFCPKQQGKIESLQWHQIKPWLQNLTQLKKKPSKNEIPVLDIDLAQLVEKM